ncbi:ComEA family DNA-binding protein [Geoalkalibacter sp.]|uniref:ComEA family DNA-binding protein n=1 Tax=Geoalkalibacter sp. TaxID=3041440 RepID=UPI00272E0BE4|nr:helix-hairpin-helix domain-containing protein [Geoalkalibacter sp.]
MKKLVYSFVLVLMIALGAGAPALAQSAAGQQVAQAALINVNTASAQELETLPGIGAVKAQKIVAHREAKRFTSVDDLLAVEGIGAATLERIRSQVTVD